MPENNNITDFTTAHIEKYWAGKLSPAEMHALEKAAMDDPFLADALEGYKNTTTATPDLNTLKERLNKRVLATAPVVSIKQKRYSWLKVAAAIIIVGGIGLLIQQFVFDNKQHGPIATVNNEEKQRDREKDTNTNNELLNAQTAPATSTNQGDLMAVVPDSTSTQENKVVTVTSNLISGKPSSGTDTVKPSLRSDVRSVTQLPQAGNEKPKLFRLPKDEGAFAKEVKKGEEEKNDSLIRSSVATVEAERVTDKSNQRVLDKDADDRVKLENNSKPKVPAAASQGRFVTADAANKNPGLTLGNTFNYRVVDAQNNPVPFANVTNIVDNVGTYTDIRGNFNLVSSDSVLNVQIRSLGFESNNYRLVPSNQFKSLTLKDDYYKRMQILDSNRQFVSGVTRKDTTELVEPVVGWGYFNTYVANNIQIPENIRKKSTLGKVELSFDVDESGQPINIKVTKSSKCKECDNEVIRLLKEGPKWKQKGRRSKTTISIAVDQK